MKTHALIDRLFETSQRNEALSLAQQICEQIDEFARARDFLMVDHLLRDMRNQLEGKPGRESVFAYGLQLPFPPRVLEGLLSTFKADPEIFEAIISNVVAHKTWRFDPTSMEEVIKRLAYSNQHEAVIAILEGIVAQGDVKDAGLGLIGIAIEFPLERKDDVMQKWVTINEQRLLALDSEGGITINSFPGEGIGWFDRGVREFGLKMATRNLENGTGVDLLNLERIQGKGLDVEKNPTNYASDWATYLFLTPYPIERHLRVDDERTFDHQNLMRSLKEIVKSDWRAKIKADRVYEIAKADVLNGAGKDPAKLLAGLVKDYREAGFPLPKPWINRMLNEVAGANHQDMEKFADTLRIAKSHRVKIDFSPFERSFIKALNASNRNLPFAAGMALLTALKEGYPVSAKFFGTWFKYCGDKWQKNQRDNFLQAIPREVLQASDHLRDRRMGADLGL